LDDAVAEMSVTARKRLPSLIWLQGLLCGALVALAPGMALLLASLLAPVIGAVMLDHQPGKPRARTAFLFAAAMCISPVHSLWTGSGDLSSAVSISLSPEMLARTWIAAGAGWGLAELAPFILRVVFTVSDQLRRKRLESLREKLRTEWGGPG
jgi:hypothetical protein